MHCVLCLMSRLSIQEIKAHHASMVQMLSYVETVDTLRSKHTEQCIVCLCLMSRLSIQEIKASHATMVQILCYTMSIRSIQTCTHISIHNFVNIQWIFNPEKVLDS